MSLKGKHIILAISGSIAAYKAAFLTRLFIKAGAEVQVIMTEAATHFISPLTLSTLSKNNVYTQVMDDDTWNDHVELGIWGDIMIVAPATANTLAKMANGLCDSAVTAVYLSARCPVFVAPAMDLDMWAHPATQRNISQLENDEVKLIPVGKGELASGLTGAGRMAEPEDIFNLVQAHFSPKAELTGQRVLITAGPTYEAIDPVRFIGNHSSGKMGIALALEIAKRGGKVDLILGPSKEEVSHPNIEVQRITNAQEMHQTALEVFPDCQAAILAAAVSDYRPSDYASQKIKKEDLTELNLKLERTPDIAAELGERKQNGQVIVGFALETANEQVNATKKLKSKNMDFIVLNSLNDKGAGFNVDTNKISIIYQDNKTRDFELKSKRKVARDIVDELIELFKKKELIV